MPVLLCSFLVLKFLKQLKNCLEILSFLFFIFEAQTVCIIVLINGVDINHFIEKLLVTVLITPHTTNNSHSLQILSFPSRKLILI